MYEKHTNKSERSTHKNETLFINKLIIYILKLNFIYSYYTPKTYVFLKSRQKPINIPNKCNIK